MDEEAAGRWVVKGVRKETVRVDGGATYIWCETRRKQCKKERTTKSPFQQPAGKRHHGSSAEHGFVFFSLSQAANTAVEKDCGPETLSLLEGAKPVPKDHPRAAS